MSAMAGEKEGKALSPIEVEAKDLLKENDEGMIDNVFDIIDELFRIEEGLPADSSVRVEWDAFYADMVALIEEYG